MGLLNLPKLAKDLTGSVSGFRAVLDANPTGLPFPLPPQAAMGLKIAQTLGLKIPTAAQIAQYTGQAKATAKAAVTRTSSEILNAIDWLH